MPYDDFLYRLRSRPSPAFAARLKAKLDRQGSARVRPFRATLLGLLLAGAAAAVTIPVVRHLRQGSDAHPVARAAVSSTQQSPAVNPEPAGNGAPASAPAARIANGPADSRPAESPSDAAAMPGKLTASASDSAASVPSVGGVPTRSAQSPRPGFNDLCRGPDLCTDKDIVDYRQDVMKTLDEQSAALGQMASGVIPQQSMTAHMQMLALAASMVPTAFEPRVAGGRAKPEVWLNWDDFAAKMRDFQLKADAGGRAQGTDAQLSALVDIANACKGCHDQYRQDIRASQ